MSNRQEAKLLVSSTSGRRPQTKAQGKKPTGAKKHYKAKRVMGNIGRGLLTAFLIFVITFTLIGGAVAIYVINFVQPQDIDLNSANLDSTTMIYANDTKTNKPKVVSQISGEQNRIWVSIDSMPDNLKNAFICTEDQRFYEHDGVDWKRTVSSFANLFLPIYKTKQGGSTITQQLVNVLTSAGKNSNDYARKIQEIVNALALEKKYNNKDTILEAYLNTINLNEGCYGVQTAAQNYFGKNVKDLDLAQCAALACMPKAPSTYDPRNHPDKNTERRVKVVLWNMLDQKKITQSQYDAAIKEKLKIVAKKSVSTRGWFEDMVITDVQTDLENKYGWPAEDALNEIYTKGLRIYTTENTDVQSAMDTVYQNTKNPNYWYQFSGDVQPQSGMMVINYSGQILGVEGGRGIKTGNMILNRATGSKRAPGSSIKPLAVYAPAMDLNKITWSTVVSKGQISIGGQPWPENDNKDYIGSMNVVDALAQSVNTVAVHIEQDMLSPTYSFDFLTKKLGFNTLVDSRVSKGKTFSDKNISLAIGSLTDGATVEEMAGGYQIFGNNGIYYKPYSYTKVTDSEGNVLLENKSQPVKAIGADTAFVMNQLLQQNVTRTGGTGSKAAIPGVLVGGKTGTTNDHKDRWFCGITPDYVGVVWYGYDKQKEVAGYNSVTNPALWAWKNVMAKADKNPIKKSFPTNGDIIWEKYDPVTGYITDKGTEMGCFKTKGILPTAPVDPSAS
jgi:penicillin-binding protein 1A